jgi:hypothetical protein
VEIEIVGAGRDSGSECGYCGARPFEAYRRFGLPVGQFTLVGHDAVVCGDCLAALRGLDAVGPVTLETLAVQHEDWPVACDGEFEIEIFRAVAGDLLSQIRFPDGPPENWQQRDSEAKSLMHLALGNIMKRSAAAPGESCFSEAST